MMDLHVHTTASDGAMHPMRILDEAALRDLSLVAITDHDTTEGLRAIAGTEWVGEEGGRAALLTIEGRYLRLLPGIEVSATHLGTGRGVHILGYGIDIGAPVLEEVLAPVRARRTHYAETIVHRLAEVGIRITWDEVLAQAGGSTAVYKTHILAALWEKGYVRSWSQAPNVFRRLFGPGGPGHVPETSLEVRLAIELILSAGGIPVVAHPGASGILDLLPQLVDWGIQGIEAHHPDHAPATADACERFGRERGIWITGGSDYHGGNGRYYKEVDGPLGGVPASTGLPARLPGARQPSLHF